MAKRQRSSWRFQPRALAKIATLVARLRFRGVTEQRKPLLCAQCLGCVEGATSPEMLAISSAWAGTRLRRYLAGGILGWRVIDGQSDISSRSEASLYAILCAP